MLKKSINLIVIVGLVLMSLGGVSASSTEEPSSWAKNKVKEAISLGLVPERLQSKYAQSITREEFASLFVTSVFAYQKNEVHLEEDTYPHPSVTREAYINDVKITDYSFKDTDNEDVKIAYAMGLVNGTSVNTFSPNSQITREEAACMLVNYCPSITSTLSFIDTKGRIKDLNKASSWAKDCICAAWYGQYFEGVSGDRYCPDNRRKEYQIVFDPKGTFTREQAICVMMNMYKPYQDISIFSVVLMRGFMAYGGTMAKMKWEVSKDSLTCVGFKDGEKLGKYTDLISAKWYFYNNTYPKYIDATDNEIVAAYAFDDQYSSARPQEIIDCGAKGINAIFDFGYATYEMHNKNFIFKLAFKNNGLYSEGWGFYGGSKQLPITYKRIK